MRLALQVLVALLLARPALAQKAGPGEAEVARIGSFVVFSDLRLGQDRVAAIVSRVGAAWDFVAAEQRWDGDLVLGHAVGVRVLSDEHMKALSKKAKGVALGPHTFCIASGFLEEERSDRTLAHELTHLQDRRHLEAKGAKLPHWLTEGRAVAMGRAYEARLGVADRRYDQAIARLASDVAVAEARRTLEDDAYLSEKKLPSVFRMEALGFFFLEFVRVHLQLDALEPRLARVVARIGRGSTLDDAFAAELGAPLADLRRAFYEHLEKTAGTEARFVGELRPRR